MKRLLFCSIFSLGVAWPAADAGAEDAMPQPTREHREMAREVGVWDAVARVWPAPGAPALESTAVETNEMLGGFWLASRYEGSFGDAPFTGDSRMGYDPESGEYVATWVDTMTPTLLVSRGSYDAATHTLTLYSDEHTCCHTGMRKRMKMVTEYRDADHKDFTIYETPAGEESWSKTMEIAYTRRK